MIALWYWKKVAKNTNNKVSSIALNTNDRFFLEKNFSCYFFLDKSDKIIFENRLGLFLAEISSIDSESVNRIDWLKLASIVVILFWNTPYKSYDDYIFTWNKNISNELKKIRYTYVFLKKEELDYILSSCLDENIFVTKEKIISYKKSSEFIDVLCSE